MKPQVDLASLLGYSKDQGIDAAIGRLSAFKAVSWMNGSIAAVIESLRQILAFADVDDLLIRDHGVDSMYMDVEIRKWQNGPAP